MLLRPYTCGPLSYAIPALLLACVELLMLPLGSRLCAADIEEIVTAKVLRVGVLAGETPPFLQGPAGGALGGLEGEFISEVARRMDVKLEVVRTARTGDELIAQVVSSRIDVAIGQLTDSLEWAKSVRFTKPYLVLQEVRLVDRLAATRAGGSTRLLASKTARVSAVAGSVVLPALQEEFGDRLGIVPTLGSAVDEVLSGKSLAAVGDDVAVVRWLQANPALGLRLELSTRGDRRPGLAIAVPWKSDDLQAWLNLCIDKCNLDGTLKSLVTKYLGDPLAR
jgi:polar amino acid transport system substrate-binding protein